ncbi:hypothetical protein Anas_01833, partial [Armadillidium nasatum]
MLLKPFPRKPVADLRQLSLCCVNFKMLHFHIFIQNYDEMIFVNDVLSEAIQGLKFLQEINFYDKTIALNCPNLRELNLHNTSIEDYEVKILLKNESVIKNSLTKLIIDETRIKVKSIKRCLLNLQNLTYFQSDKTIEAALQLFETVKHSAEASDAIPKFKTTVCKNIFLGTIEEPLTDDFLKWLGEKFPEVKHLNLSLQEEYNEFASCLISSWKHITHLELSSLGKEDSVSVLIPAIVSCENLITLKLEKFWNVDITPLGNKLKKLEKLTLINNIFVRSQKIQFENLKEFQNLKMLHFHTFIESRVARKYANYALREAIQGLKFLQEINFYDCWLSRSTINSIALNCPNLRELYLHDTSIEDDDVKILLKKESVIKNSLTKLLIDETRIKEESIKQCLLNLQNLTYFQSDKTIQAALQLYEAVKHSAEASDAIPKFKTTVFKNIFFKTDEEPLTNDFLKWLVEKFPEVKYLNILLREEYNEFVSSLIISWKYITQLELTSLGEEETVSALIPSIVSCENLITLKLEKFWNVDITPLGNKLKKLEKLTLINNIFVRRSQEIQFENLKELQVIFFSEESE